MPQNDGSSINMQDVQLMFQILAFNHDFVSAKETQVTLYGGNVVYRSVSGTGPRPKSSVVIIPIYQYVARIHMMSDDYGQPSYVNKLSGDQIDAYMPIGQYQVLINFLSNTNPAYLYYLKDSGVIIGWPPLS